MKKFLTGISIFTMSIALLVYMTGCGDDKKIKDSHESVISDTTSIVGEEKAFQTNLITDNKFTYSESPFDDLAIVGAEKIQEDCIFPTIVDGKYVTAIGIEAFKDSEILKKVTVKYPLNIFMQAFIGSSIESFKLIDDNNVVVEHSREFYNEAFKGCTQLKTVYIDAQLDRIDASCFENCTALESFICKSCITDIPDGCFRNCSNLTEVELPATVKSISPTAFEGCTSLKKIRGYEYSFIQEYCENNGYEFESMSLLME